MIKTQSLTIFKAISFRYFLFGDNLKPEGEEFVNQMNTFREGVFKYAKAIDLTLIWLLLLMM